MESLSEMKSIIDNENNIIDLLDNTSENSYSLSGK